MERHTNCSGFKDTSYLVVNNGTVVEIGHAFTELTGYETKELFQKDISEVVNKLLRINRSVQDIENTKTNPGLFLFTKSLEALEVAISINPLEDTNEKLYIFTEEPTARINDKLIFVEQLFKDNVMGCAVFSVPDFLILKTNQKFISFLDSPYNSMENSIGKPFKEILAGFEGTEAEATWNTVLMTQETKYLKEYRHEGFTRGVTYWEGTLTPIFETGKMKYITETVTDVTERVHDRQQRIEQARIIQSQKEQLEQQNAQLNAIIENMSDALLIFDKDGNYTKLNKTARETYAPLCGHSEKIGDGRIQAENYDADGCLISPENILGRRVMRGEKIVNNQIKIQSGNNFIYTEVNGTPIYDNQGNFSAGVLCCRDITQKVLNEETIKESEAKYKNLYNNMLMGHAYYQIIMDENGKPIDYTITEVNPAYETITGLKRNEIIGKKASELFPGIEYSTIDWVGIIGEVAMKGKTVSKEVYDDVVDGWFNVYYYRPKPGFMGSIFSDITKRKNNEEELNKIKEQLEEAQEFAHLGYWEFNTISGDYPWSDELFRMYGYKPQEFVPTLNDFINMIHPDDKDFMMNIILDPLIVNERELDFRIIRHDHKIIWIHEKIQYDHDATGKEIRRYGVVLDITQQKLSELKLKESEEKFKEIAENLGEVILVRQEGQVVYISPAYEQLWGRTCQSLYDNPHSFIDSIHPEDKERIWQTHLIENDISNRSSDEQFRIIKPDGEMRWIWTRKYPICDQNGGIVRLLGISEDITKIKESEESLRHAKEEAETANKAKSQFLANMSHEIRTPMNGILGMAQLLAMDLQDEQKEMATMIKTSGDNLLTIINDILDFSKIEAGKVRLSHGDFSLLRLVNEVDNIIRPLVVRKGLEYKSYIEKEIEGYLIGDSGRLKQILINLLGNAIKFTERGNIELSIVKGKVFQDRLQLVFSIKDTGIGIADDKIGQLFTYFTQGDDSVTKKYGGTGLGLAISKQLINMMDGEISVESELGVGSNFLFTAIFMQAEDAKELTEQTKKMLPI